MATPENQLFQRMSQLGGRAPGDPVLRASSTQLPSTTLGADIQPRQNPVNPGIIPRAPVTAAPAGTVGREAIDPASRGERLTFDAQIPQVTPIGPFAGPRDVVAGTQGTPQGLDFSQFGLNPADFAAGGRFDVSAGGGVGGGFQVTPQSVLEQALATFNSQIPGLDIGLRDATEGLAKNTAALGRSGSGLFNRDTDRLTERERATREGLLGNLSFQGATTDAANDLQAQIATGGFQQRGLDRLLASGTSGAQNALQAALTGANLNQRGQEFDINNLINTDRFNIGNQLTADQLNQGADLTARGQDINVAGLNQGGEQFNINNSLQVALEQLGLAERQQGREDNLANQAQSDLFRQLQLLTQGFQGDPTQALFQQAEVQAGAGREHGAQAAQTNQGIGGAGNAISQLFASLIGGGNTGVRAPSNADGYYNTNAANA